LEREIAAEEEIGDMQCGSGVNEQEMRRLQNFWNGEADRWEKQADPSDSRRFLTTTRVDCITQLIKKNREKCCVLDAACGPGFISEKLIEEGFDVYGYDISRKFIDNTKKRLSHKINDLDFRFRVSENGEIPFPGAQFDLILAIGILPFLKDGDFFIEGLKTHLRSGGYVVASCVNGLSTYIIKTIFKFWHTLSLPTAVRLLRTGIWYEEYGVYHKSQQAHNIRQLDKLFLKKGFKKIDEMMLFGHNFFEKDPLKRAGINKIFAHYFGWLHYGVYRVK
jgi:2-polyprenyl-3-methyl-5-hydroxy-6-metoxy-1,4-benzoquinol methylase